MTLTFIALLDFIGTFAFAISGALVAVRHRLDLFGVLVLAFAAGSAGGILRDVLIGSIPPVAINNWRIISASVLAGIIVFLTFPHAPRSGRRFRLVLVFDAAGLALFAVTGTQKALDYGASPITAPLLGMLSGIGGGMLRDILVTETPAVFRGEVYALAALAGASIVVIGDQFKISPTVAALTGAVICFAIRIIALRHGWELPIASPPDPAGSANKQPDDLPRIP